MTTRDSVREALEQWARGDRNAFKAFFAQHTDLLETYQGPGDPFNFVLPALFVREFCLDLLDAGFPVEKLFADNLEDFAWVDWKPALEHVSRTAPELLLDLAADKSPAPQDLYGFAFLAHNDPVYLATVELWPDELRDLVTERAQAFADTTQEELDARFAAIRAAAESPLVTNALRHAA